MSIQPIGSLISVSEIFGYVDATIESDPLLVAHDFVLD